MRTQGKQRIETTDCADDTGFGHNNGGWRDWCGGRGRDLVGEGRGGSGIDGMRLREEGEGGEVILNY